MGIEENRLAHLRAIVDEEAQQAGGKLRAGYRSVATATGLQEEYIYQLYKGIKKSIGQSAAKSLARAYANGRSPDWFDYPADEESLPMMIGAALMGSSNKSADGYTTEEQALIDSYRKTTQAGKAAVRQILAALPHQTEQPTTISPVIDGQSVREVAFAIAESFKRQGDAMVDPVIFANAISDMFKSSTETEKITKELS